MQKTNSAGSRVRSDDQPGKMPAKKHSKLVKNLLVLLVSIAAVAVLVVGMCLIRMHFSANKNNTELPNNSQNNVELSDAAQNNAGVPGTDADDTAPHDAGADGTGSSDATQNDTTASSSGQIVSELLGIWSFNGEATYSFDEHNKGRLAIGDEQYSYTYSASADELTLDYADASVEDAAYRFTVKGDQLTLIGGEGTAGGTYQLSRAD